VGSIAIWGLGLIALLFARRLKWPPYLREFLCVVGASASTVAVLNRFLFVDVFAGRSGEAMLLTLPLTLLGAPLVFIVMLVCLGKLCALRSR
jgi:hypothetical protein